MKLKIHFLYILLGLVLVFAGSGYTFIAYTVTLILHEMGHSTVASKYGYQLDEIKLMPYGAVLEGSCEGLKAREEVMIALAGPIFNLILSVIFTAVWWLVPVTYFVTETFVIANLVTALFNLLPAFPLDGGRVFLALLATKMSPVKAERAVKKVSVIISIVFAVLFCVSLFFGMNFTYCIIAVFIMMGVVTAGKSGGYKRILESTHRLKMIKKGLQVKEIIVSKDMSLYNVSKLLNSNYYYRISIANENCKQIRTFDESRIRELLETSPDIYLPISKYC